jgi:hypothetical protein
MFSLHDIFDGKPDHPMLDLKEVRRLLAELPTDDPFKELEEIASWLDSVKAAPGYLPDVRTEIIKLLDESHIYRKFVFTDCRYSRCAAPDTNQPWHQPPAER